MSSFVQWYLFERMEPPNVFYWTHHGRGQWPRPLASSAFAYIWTRWRSLPRLLSMISFFSLLLLDLDNIYPRIFSHEAAGCWCSHKSRESRILVSELLDLLLHKVLTLLRKIAIDKSFNAGRRKGRMRSIQKTVASECKRGGLLHDRVRYLIPDAVESS
ncbi:hypothetical protein SELMODRAFT_415988 [Selaginella moellendorffii]|uniref:Uncharacterized protein n=1 Tax=Selaginella moellendorffii TaxID=88036 RepID=D8RXQ7_SELML|nr:hypothetical protein SELMODRAFT_415988 [Selaginella moellendorffii]